MGHFWFHTNEVLGAGVDVIVNTILHSGFGSDLGGANAGTSLVVGEDGVVKEDRVLVEVIFRLRHGYSGAL